MKRARTRLQSRLRPIKSYEYGGDIDPWDGGGGGGGGDLPAMPEGRQPWDERPDVGPSTDIERDDGDYEGQINRNALGTKLEDLTSEVEQVGKLRRRINPDDPNSPDREGLTDSEKIRRSQFRDPAEAFRHPTYAQLAADPDLRRGRTRMVPRVDIPPIGFVGPPEAGNKLGTQRGPYPVPISPELQEYHNWMMQRGGSVPHYDEGGVSDRRFLGQLNEQSIGNPRGGFDVPIGRGSLRLNPTLTPDQTLEVEGQFEHPIGNRGTSAGVEGYYRKNIGPEGLDAKPDWGAGIRLKQKFKKGGRVKKFEEGGVQVAEKGDIKRGRDFGIKSLENDDDEYESLGYGDASRGREQLTDPNGPPSLGISTGERPGLPNSMEFWRKRVKERPMSAIDTRYAKRGGVIKRYQGAGMVDAEGRPLDVPVEPPQQPAPGAAGQATPATPPEQPATTTPAPTQAIGTQPKEFADPLAGFKDDADVAAERQAEQEALSGGRQRSVRPGGEVFMGSPPPDRVPQQHEDFDRLQTLKSMLPQIAKEDTTKTGRFIKEAQTTVDALERRVHNETIRQNDAQRKDWARTHAGEVKKADHERRVGIMQIGDLDQQLNGQFGALVTGPGGYQDLVNNAKTPEERRAASFKLAASPIKQMPDNERAEAARQLLALNDRLSPATAAQLVLTLGTPPMRGTKGVNELTGRAAANFTLGPKDPVGNFTVITPRGTYRVDPDTYMALKVSRNKGYDTMVGLHNDYIAARRREDKPGWVARQTDAAIDAVRGVFK